MAKRNGKASAEDCFPLQDNKEHLPQPIPATRIIADIEAVYQQMLDLVAESFTQASQGHHLQPSRSKLANLKDDLLKKMQLQDGDGDDLATFADLRRASNRLKKVFREHLESAGKKKQSNTMHITVAHALRMKVESIKAKYRDDIAPHIPTVSQPAAPSAPNVRTKASAPSKPVVAQAKEPVVLLENTEPAVLQAMNNDIPLEPDVLPQPVHGYVDLDFYAQENHKHRTADVLPTWVRSLSEPEANRLLIAITEDDGNLTRRERIDAFFQDTTLPQATDDEARHSLVSEISGNAGLALSSLRGWLKRHAIDGQSEQQGVYIQKPSFLRMAEQKQLMKPNLRRLVRHHFQNTQTPLPQRSLLDIGTWDGSLPYTLQRDYADMHGIESNEERYEQLMRNPAPNLWPHNLEMQDILSHPHEYNFASDTILFSHVLYFLHQNEQDLQALQWAHDNLKDHGKIIAVLNDAQPEPGSRAHLRQSFGARKTGALPSYYEEWFASKGIATRSIRPSLHFKAHTTEGKVAMRDLLRFMLPGDTRQNDAALDDYQALIDEQGGIFKHTLHVMVAYQDPADAPAAAPDRSVDVPRRHIPRQKISAKPILQPVHRPQPTELPELPVITDATQLSPADILEYIETIEEAAWGNDTVAMELVQASGLQWGDYRYFVQARHSYQAVVRILDHIADQGTMPTLKRLAPEEYTLLIKEIRRQYPEEAAFEAYLREIGLYTRYYAKTYNAHNKKPATRKRHPTATRDPILPSEIVRIEKPAPAPTPKPAVQPKPEPTPEPKVEIAAPEDALLAVRQAMITDIAKNENHTMQHLLQARAQLIALLKQE